jgi:hypothetical protein
MVQGPVNKGTSQPARPARIIMQAKDINILASTAKPIKKYLQKTPIFQGFPWHKSKKKKTLPKKNKDNIAISHFQRGTAHE